MREKTLRNLRQTQLSETNHLFDWNWGENVPVRARANSKVPNFYRSCLKRFRCYNCGGEGWTPTSVELKKVNSENFDWSLTRRSMKKSWMTDEWNALSHIPPKFTCLWKWNQKRFVLANFKPWNFRRKKCLLWRDKFMETFHLQQTKTKWFTADLDPSWVSFFYPIWNNNIWNLDECSTCKKSVMLCGFAEEIIQFLDNGCDTCKTQYNLETKFTVLM